MSRHSLGYAREVDRFDGKVLAESDTITCEHCNCVVHMHDRKTGQKLNNVLVHCKQCDKYICVPCAEKARCAPFEKKLEELDARARLFAAIGV